MSSISFKNALGVHESATLARAQRAEIIANNLSNADTPGFKARDIDFLKVLKGEQRRSMELARTHEAHRKGKKHVDFELMYRNPYQPSIDGNTVDPAMEQTEYSKNTLGYNTSFHFLSNRFKGLKNVIRGEI